MSRLDAEFDAVIVGSGPNGLTAAAVLAANGKSVLVLEGADSVGGGVHSAELTRPGFIHDVGSTIHALGASSPAFAELNLSDHGLRFADFPTLLTHVLPDGGGASMYRSLDETAEGLRQDGARYRRLLGPLVDNFEQLAPMILGPVLKWPRHPLTLARFGVRAVTPMSVLAKVFRTDEARALLAGNAAHSFAPLNHPLTGAFAMMLQASGHANGWPVAVGGSSAIATALVSVIEANGGVVETGVRVGSRVDLPAHRALLMDTTPSDAAAILGSELPSRRQRRYQRFKRAPGAFKVDYALREPVPWTNPDARTSGTVHVCGHYHDVVLAEKATSGGEMPERPFVLVCQATIVDATRAPEGKHTAWVYAHVPNNYRGPVDVKSLIEDQIHRFAPGFSEAVLDATVHRPQDLESWNRNLVGGDIAGGSYQGLQAVRRPTLSPHPYRTGAGGAYLCSASTPPGAGAHGMCGYHAAHDVLARELS